MSESLVSFPTNDYYYDATLDEFFGPNVKKRHSETINFLGRDGVNFVIDEYRQWLVQLLQAEGFNTFEDAYEKYPFLNEDIDDDDSEQEDDSDNPEENDPVKCKNKDIV